MLLEDTAAQTLILELLRLLWKSKNRLNRGKWAEFWNSKTGIYMFWSMQIHFCSILCFPFLFIIGNFGLVACPPFCLLPVAKHQDWPNFLVSLNLSQKFETFSSLHFQTEATHQTGRRRPAVTSLIFGLRLVGYVKAYLELSILSVFCPRPTVWGSCFLSQYKDTQVRFI